jgi:hypothetical protein
MSSEEKFKDLLKQKLEAKDFPFNPENWEKARELIDESRSRRKRILPFILLCIGIFISGGLCVYFFDEVLNPATSDLAVQAAAEAVVGPADKEKNKGVVPGEPFSTNRKNSTTINKTVPEPKSGTVKADPEQNAETIETTVPKNVQRESVSPLKNDEFNKTAAVESRNKETTRAQVNASRSQGMASQAALKRRTKIKTISNAPAATNRSNAAAQDFVTGAKAEAKIKRTDSKNKKEVPSNAQPDVTIGSRPEVKQMEAPAGQVELAEKTPETIPAPGQSPETLVGNPVAATPTTESATETKAEVPVALIKTDSTQEKSDESPKNIFSVEGGLNYHLAWKDDKGKDANGINPVVGFNYLRVLNSRMGISLGAHYTTIGNLGNYSNQTEQKRYGFGNVSAMTVITPVKIHYLYAPLRVSYALNSKNTVGVGYAFAYLLTVNSKVENYTQQLNETSDHKISKTNGYAQGFNNYDSQLLLFYRRKIYSDLSANAELFFGLSDIKDNTFFASKHFERNTGVKFTLIYNIFKR